MDGRSFRNIGSNALNGFKNNGLMRKTVANLVTVFFIFNGIPVPTSFAATNAMLSRDPSRSTRTITLEEANGRQVARATTMPSGVAVEPSSPLSKTAAATSAYDPSQNTVLPNRPSVGSGVGSGGAVVSGSIQTQQSSSKNIQVQYSNLDSDDYAFVYLSSGTPMSLTNGITVGVNGAAGSKLKMELKDASGNVASFLLTLSGTMTNYALSGAYLSNYSSYLDTTHIAEVVFVVERARMGASGSFAIETAGLSYTPLIAPDPTLTATDVTMLSEVHHVYSIADFEGATASLAQQSSSLYTLSYSMSQPGNWVVGLTAFDDYGSPEVVETRDLSLMNRLVMGLRLASGYGDVKIEFEDVNRNKAIVYLDAVGTTEQFYAIGTNLLRAEYPGFDLQHVLNINVVVEKNNVSQPTGQLQVRLGGHPYTPVISGTAYDQNLITELPNQPVLSSGTGWSWHGAEATIQVVQTSSNDFTFDYSLPDEGDYVFSYFGSGYFDASGAWTGMPMNLPSSVVLAVNGPAGKKLKFEVIETTGVRKIGYLALEGSFRNYTLDLLGLGVDPQQVAQIVFTAERSQMGAAGRVTVGVRGLLYIPVIPPSPVLTPADVTVLPNVRHLISIANPPATASVNPQSSLLYNLAYALPREGDWAVGLSSFDDFGTEVRETQDLSTLQNFVIGLKLASGTGRVKLEFEDANRVKSFVYLSAVNTTEQFYAIPLPVLLAGNSQIDLSQIANVNVVVEKNSMSESAGELQVRLGGHPFGPEVPEGWTRAASNVNFAFVTKLDPYSSRTVELHVLNLLTGQDVIVGVMHPRTGEGGFGFVDVTSDETSGGALAVFSIVNSYAERTSVSVVRVSDVTQRLDLIYQEKEILEGSHGVLRSISLEQDGAFLVLGLTMSDASTRTAGIDAKTLQLAVPAGWTRAASNENFAFATEDWINPDNRNNYTRLKVQDLRTGEIQELYLLQSPPNNYTSMDVSPDGELVYFGARNAYTTPATGWLRVQQVSDATKQADITGIPQSVSFLPDGNVSVVMATAYRNGTQIGNVYVVDPTTLVSTLSHYTLLTQADAVLDEGYLVISTKITYSNTYEVFVYDASAGTDHLVLTPIKIFYHASQAAGGSSGSGSYRTIDVARNTAGEAVLIVGISAVGNQDVDYSKSFAINLVTGTQDTVPGAVTAVTYRENIAIGTVTSASGVVATKYLDLDTLQVFSVPPVPSGWTRAASNENFAFYVKSERVGSYNVDTLQLMDLKTGEIRDVVKTKPPVIISFSRYDVSPDGNAVIYEMYSRMHVQKITDPETVWVGGGIPKTITMATHSVEFVYSNGARISISTETFKESVPTVAVPTVTAGVPSASGVVTLKGTKAASTSIWYSLDGGTTYKQLVSATRGTSWSGSVTLPVGSTTILVQARKTAVVSGKSTVLLSESVSVGPIVYTAPTVAVPTVVAGVPSASGVVMLKGTKAASTSIWYSLDGGKTYKQLVGSSTATSWSGKITLPVGSTTLLIQARKTAIVSGKRTTVVSETVVVGPIVYTAPTVAVPTVTAGVPSASGVVTLKGTKTASTSIWYSLDGGTTYKQLVSAARGTSWSGKITLPVGSTKLLIQARMTAVVSGVSTTILSDPVPLMVVRT